jgi:hypothetical protein
VGEVTDVGYCVYKGLKIAFFGHGALANGFFVVVEVFIFFINIFICHINELKIVKLFFIIFKIFIILIKFFIQVVMILSFDWLDKCRAD